MKKKAFYSSPAIEIASFPLQEDVLSVSNPMSGAIEDMEYADTFTNWQN